MRLDIFPLEFIARKNEEEFLMDSAEDLHSFCKVGRADRRGGGGGGGGVTALAVAWACVLAGLLWVETDAADVSVKTISKTRPDSSWSIITDLTEGPSPGGPEGAEAAAAAAATYSCARSGRAGAATGAEQPEEAEEGDSCSAGGPGHSRPKRSEHVRSAGALSQGDSNLQCYVCRTDTHEGCADLGPRRAYLRRCSGDAARPVCRLIRQEVAGPLGAQRLTVRECGREAASPGGGCYVSAFGSQTVCECFANACNAAPAPAPATRRRFFSGAYGSYLVPLIVPPIIFIGLPVLR